MRKWFISKIAGFRDLCKRFWDWYKKPPDKEIRELKVVFNSLRESTQKPPNTLGKRQFAMLIQGFSGVAITLLGIFLAWRELGSEVFNNGIFWALFVGWIYFGLISFYLRWREIGDNDETKNALLKNTEAINKLIEEIKKDRELKNKGGGNHGV